MLQEVKQKSVIKPKFLLNRLVSLYPFWYCAIEMSYVMRWKPLAPHWLAWAAAITVMKTWLVISST